MADPLAPRRVPRRAHVVGAGLAGLSAALRLAKAGWQVTLYEAAAQAGGRCRSYEDAKLERSIDNGNHILLAANTAALDFVREIGPADRLTRPAQEIGRAACRERVCPSVEIPAGPGS